MKVNIVNRGEVIVEIEGKRLTIQGEVYLPGHGSPDIVLYSNSVVHWDYPNAHEPIDGSLRNQLLSQVKLQLERDRGMSVVIE